MIYLKELKYGTPEHKDMIVLRNKVLREPFGIVFSEEELKRDESDFLLVCCLPRTNEIIGCCVLSPIDADTLQLRQMAVDFDWQSQHIGSRVLEGAEAVAKREAIKYICLHARETAVAFYEKHNYNIMGDEFMEVGIPHFEMIKQI